MAVMSIGKHIIGNGLNTLMIAEEGQANQGDVSLALDMCKIASKSDADGIEYQFFLADDMYIREHPGHVIYTKCELAIEQIKTIIDATHAEELICQVAGLSPAIIEHCADFGADVFVVNASDLTNPQIIDPVIASGKPFFLATLMANLEEIDWAVEYVNSKCSSEFGLLHGQHVMSSGSAHGVPPEYLQLDCISMLNKRYGCVVGFVDHTATEFVPALAAAKGAAIITKHLAPEVGWRGPDWTVCLDPEKWRSAKNMLDYACRANGESKEITQAEVKDRSLHRRSLYTRDSLPIGHIVGPGDLVALRPGDGGVDPRYLSEFVGKTLQNNLVAQTQIARSDFDL